MFVTYLRLIYDDLYFHFLFLSLSFSFFLFAQINNLCNTNSIPLTLRFVLLQKKFLYYTLSDNGKS